MRIEITQKEADALRDTSHIVVAIDQNSGQIADYAVGQAASSEDIEITESVEYYMPDTVDIDEEDERAYAVVFYRLWWDRDALCHVAGEDSTAPAGAVAEYLYGQGRIPLGSVPASVQNIFGSWEDVKLDSFVALVAAILNYTRNPSAESCDQVDAMVRRITE